jgi:hypothetical protein
MSTENSQKVREKEVSIDTVYSEMYTEMRRHRDYQFSSATWYTTLLLALVGLILAAKYGENKSGVKDIIINHAEIKWIIVLVAAVVCFNSCYAILYSHQRYSDLRGYTDDNLEPSWRKKFTPRTTMIQPHILLVANQLILVAIIIASLCLPA